MAIQIRISFKSGSTKFFHSNIRTYEMRHLAKKKLLKFLEVSLKKSFFKIFKLSKMSKRNRSKKNSVVLDKDPSVKYSVKIDETKGSSACWKYFGFALRNGEIFDSQYYYCRLCFPGRLDIR